MQPFVRALEDERTGIPVPWDRLARLRVKPIPGTLVILLGAPGALKSTLSLAWAYHLMPAEPVLLISLDTDSKTQAARMVSLITGGAISWEEVSADPLPWAEYLRMQDLPLRVFDLPIAPEDISEVISACIEYWGRPPGLVIVDDVSKLWMKDREYTGFDTALIDLQRAARRHGTVVLALHHVHSGDSMDRTKPVKLRDSKYTGQYIAEIILGVYRPTDDRLNVSVLKNRFAIDNPNGTLFVSLFADPAHAVIKDPDYWTDMRWSAT